MWEQLMMDYQTKMLVLHQKTDLVCYVSFPKKTHFLSPSLSYTPFSSLLLFSATIFCIVQPLSISSTTFPYISRAISAWQIFYLCFLLLLCFLSIICSIRLLHKELISHSLQGVSYPSLSISPRILLLCMLVLLYTLCLFLFSLIPPPCFFSCLLSSCAWNINFTERGCYVILYLPCLPWSICLFILRVFVSIEPVNNWSISLVYIGTHHFTVCTSSQINNNDPTSFTSRASHNNL